MSEPISSPPRAQLALYRRLVRALPRELVREHGADMVALFGDRLCATQGVGARLALWFRALGDLFRHGLALHSRFRRVRRHRRFPDSSPSDLTMSERLSSSLAALLRDARYGLRLLRKDWSFTLTATLILGLAIGANTAVFSFVDAYLLRPLPFPEPDRLGTVTRWYEGGGEGRSQDGFIWQAVRDADPEAFEATLYSSSRSAVNLAAGDSAVNVAQQRVAAGYFAVFGVPPMIGREFTEAEDVPDGPAVTVLSHGLWQRLFAGDPGAIGETIMLRGEPHTVVGVMPPDFPAAIEAELWTPLRPSTSGEGGGTNYSMMVRLNDGATWAEAEATLRAIGQSLLEGDYPGGRFERLGVVSLHANLTDSIRDRLEVLWIAVGAVLLISCVNVSGLLLVRGNRRQREIATRLALGSGRTAITRQLLIESVVLALLGGAVGILFSWGMMRGLDAIGTGVAASWRTVELDGRVLAVSLAATFGTALLFGLAPALQARAVTIQDALRAGGRAMSGSGKWGRRLLVVGEVGLSVVLLVMAGLLLRTFLHFQTLDPGFEPRNLATFSVSLQDARYETRADVQQLFEEGLRRVRALPAVVDATAALGVPYERQLNLWMEPADFQLPEGMNQVTNATYVTPGYFDVLGIEVVRGRALEIVDDADGAPVVVVNEAFASHFLADEDPIGRSISLSDSERRIVGVVGDVKHGAGFGPYEPIDDVPTVYMPVGQVADAFFPIVHQWFAPAWLVRVQGDVREALPLIERELASVDPLLPIASVRLASQVQSQAIAQQRFVAILVGALALASVFLAGLGIWGLVASTVVEQRREIGIRMALGAGPGAAISVVAKPSIQLAVIGAVLGIGGSVLAGRAVSSMLWGVTPSDPVTYLGVAFTLVVAAAIASLIPATRAARLDPARTLQAD